MTPDFTLCAFVLSIWASTVGAWIGALDQPLRPLEILRCAALFGFLSGALFIVNGFVLC